MRFNDLRNPGAVVRTTETITSGASCPVVVLVLVLGSIHEGFEVRSPTTPRGKGRKKRREGRTLVAVHVVYVSVREVRRLERGDERRALPVVWRDDAHLALVPVVLPHEVYDRVHLFHVLPNETRRARFRG